jgi:hypothetical protein
MNPNSKKVVYRDLTYRQVLEIWNKHLNAWAEDMDNQEKLKTKKYWDSIMDAIEDANGIEITVNHCIKEAAE